MDPTIARSVLLFILAGLCEIGGGETPQTADRGHDTGRGYARHDDPHQVVSASRNPVSVPSPTQAM